MSTRVTPKPLPQTVIKQRDCNGRFLKGNTIGFPSGQSGNPLGPPRRESCVTSLLKDILGEIDTKTGKTNARLLAEALFRNALKDPQFMKEAMNRCEGKVTDEVDIQSRGVSIIYELTGGNDAVTRGSQKELPEGLNEEEEV